MKLFRSLDSNQKGKVEKECANLNILLNCLRAENQKLNTDLATQNTLVQQLLEEIQKLKEDHITSTSNLSEGLEKTNIIEEISTENAELKLQLFSCISDLNNLKTECASKQSKIDELSEEN
jgi:hypothetical protein